MVVLGILGYSNFGVDVIFLRRDFVNVGKVGIVGNFGIYVRNYFEVWGGLEVVNFRLMLFIWFY